MSKRAMGSFSSNRGAEGDDSTAVVQDVLVPWVLKPNSKPIPKSTIAGQIKTNEQPEEEETVYHRYYHLFVKDELRDLVCAAAQEEGYRVIRSPSSPGVGGEGKGEGQWMRIRGEGWEADNWWIEAEVGEGPYQRDTISAEPSDVPRS